MAGHLMPFAAFLVKPKPGAAALLKIVLNPGRSIRVRPLKTQ